MTVNYLWWFILFFCLVSGIWSVKADRVDAKVNWSDILFRMW